MMAPLALPFTLDPMALNVERPAGEELRARWADLIRFIDYMGVLYGNRRCARSLKEAARQLRAVGGDEALALAKRLDLLSPVEESSPPDAVHIRDFRDLVCLSLQEAPWMPRRFYQAEDAPDLGRAFHKATRPFRSLVLIDQFLGKGSLPVSQFAKLALHDRVRSVTIYTGYGYRKGKDNLSCEQVLANLRATDWPAGVTSNYVLLNSTQFRTACHGRYLLAGRTPDGEALAWFLDGGFRMWDPDLEYEGGTFVARVPVDQVRKIRKELSKAGQHCT